MSSCTWPSCHLNLVPHQWGHHHQPAPIRLPSPALFRGRKQEVVMHHTTGRRGSALSTTPGKGTLGSQWKSDTHHAGKRPWAISVCSLPRVANLEVSRWSSCSVTESRPTLCDPFDCSMPGSPVLSSRISWGLLKFMSIESVMLANHLILCHPLLLLPSIFPSIRVFSSESALCIRWPNASASASVLPMNIQSGMISFRIDVGLVSWWSVSGSVTSDSLGSYGV